MTDVAVAPDAPPPLSDHEKSTALYAQAVADRQAQTVDEDPGDYTTPPAPPVSALDAIQSHHVNSLGSVNHSEIVALIAALRQEIGSLWQRIDGGPQQDFEQAPTGSPGDPTETEKLFS